MRNLQTRIVHTNNCIRPAGTTSLSGIWRLLENNVQEDILQVTIFVLIGLCDKYLIFAVFDMICNL